MINVVGKSILIRVDGTHTIGLGHIYRMKSLALSLREAGSNVAFLTKDDKVANNLLGTTGLSCFIFQPASYNLVLEEAIKEQQPDCVIQDILETSHESIEAIRRLSRAKIINFDDVGAGLAMADVVINSFVFSWGRYRADEVQTRLCEGARYTILQPAISKYSCLNKMIPDRAGKILLAFGGTDTHYVTERALEAVNDIRMVLDVKINLGPASNVTPRLEQIIEESRHRVEVIRFAEDLFKEFYQTDLVICGGGNMLCELATLGIPTVSIATEPHEIDNINYWSGIGTTVYLGWEKTLNITQISETVNSMLLDRERRTKMSKIGKQIMDSRGVVRVLKIIEETLK